MYQNIKYILFYFLLISALSSCALSSKSYEKQDNKITQFITGTAILNKVKDVHVINMVHAIGAPNNSIVIGKYKYYQWQYNRAVGVSTLFGGGSTTLYCSMSAETQNNKIKLITWYGNQCSIFLDPIGDYFNDKLNIVVFSDEEEKKSALSTTKNEVVEEAKDKKLENSNKSVIEIKEKVIEPKILQDKNLPLEKSSTVAPLNENKTLPTVNLELVEIEVNAG